MTTPLPELSMELQAVSQGASYHNSVYHATCGSLKMLAEVLQFCAVEELPNSIVFSVTLLSPCCGTLYDTDRFADEASEITCSCKGSKPGLEDGEYLLSLTDHFDSTKLPPVFEKWFELAGEEPLSSALLCEHLLEELRTWAKAIQPVKLEAQGYPAVG